MGKMQELLFNTGIKYQTSLKASTVQRPGVWLGNYDLAWSNQLLLKL